MEAAMPWKVRKTESKDTCHGPDFRKSKCACIVEANESTRKRMERKDHQDHIAGKGINSLSRHDLVHKFIPMPQALNISGAQAAVDKEWE